MISEMTPARIMSRQAGRAFYAAEVVTRQPEEQLVPVRIAYNERWPAPLHATRADALRREVRAERLGLFLFEPDEEPAAARARWRLCPGLIEDQLEAEELHLADTVVRVPVW